MIAPDTMRRTLDYIENPEGPLAAQFGVSG